MGEVVGVEHVDPPELVREVGGAGEVDLFPVPAGVGGVDVLPVAGVGVVGHHVDQAELVFSVLVVAILEEG